MANTKNDKKSMGRAGKGQRVPERAKAKAKPQRSGNGTKDRIEGESKQATLIRFLERSEGATIEEMAKATDWQHHSVRGVISGVLKKRLGLSITSEKSERGRIYRINGSVS